MKTFKNFLFEENKVKPVSPARQIPSKLPPKSPNIGKSTKKQEEKPKTPERKPDRFEKSPDLGPKPYTRRGK